MDKWLKWAIELQSIAQIGLTYTKDQIEMCFDANKSDNWVTQFD